MFFLQCITGIAAPITTALSAFCQPPDVVESREWNVSSNATNAIT